MTNKLSDVPNCRRNFLFTRIHIFSTFSSGSPHFWDPQSSPAAQSLLPLPSTVTNVRVPRDGCNSNINSNRRDLRIWKDETE
ncbi:Hypothetical predicted protein [Octopus vulgaris]|uniref:Uncharacterized protein n=1 Tax=Octopus vulgaris TaxID=6645 RepID=A0AA36FB99_OCTVU|nr:Hypothetical predicted protein [Octopus vulgaris]